jgi:predicted DNA-binding transcriptional regulator YafY
MPRTSQQKLKILYILKMFYEKTDVENTITVPQIISELASLGINAERKSIYDDIEALKFLGYDIVKTKTKTHNYFLASREFEIPELKLLIDSVLSSRFITQKKSQELVKKIEKLASKHQFKKLKRQMYACERVKTMNESIYYTIDRINDAIAENKQIKFKYFDWSVNKKKVYRKDGELYQTNPISLVYDNDNYYLIAYSEQREDYIHYRVDRMDKAEIVEKKRYVPQQDFDLAQYIKPVFSMYLGKLVDVSIEFDNLLINVIIDRFGKDTEIIKTDEEHFVAQLKVAISPMFLSWIIGFGDKARILSPDYIIEEVCNLANTIIYNYDKTKVRNG